jgi:hypothetical protein
MTFFLREVTEMKIFSFLATFLLSFANLPAALQVSAPAAGSSPQAATLLAQSAAALNGRAALSDVTLSGTARRIAGSDDESGTVTVKALATGAMRLDFSLPSGTLSEVRATRNGVPVGDWSGPDGVSHSIASHNLSTDWGWFPAFTLSNVNSSATTVLTYVGQETRSGHSVQHLNVTQQFPNQKGSVATLLQHLSQLDIYFDASTYLPAAITYNIHPDNDAGLDLPVEVDFSDYHAVNGAQIPFHVQKYLNNGLALDLQFQNVTTNSGLSASDFTVQ